jgi:3',5'-cyclic AMP phosphodiesterase CpdA
MNRSPFEHTRQLRAKPWKYAFTADWGVRSLGGAYIAIQDAVLELMRSWSPDAFILGGDNAYMDGSGSQVEANWDLWADELAADGELGEVLWVYGNHDLDTQAGQPTADYFDDDERYKVVTIGPVAFVLINSGYNTAGIIVEPDGIGEDSVQWMNLRRKLATTQALFRVAVLHHPPHSSSSSYSPGTAAWRIPWSKYGIDLVLSGHGHGYERLLVDEVPHIVAGVGGAYPVGFGTPVTGSLVRVSGSYGAVELTVAHSAEDLGARTLSATFRDTAGQSIDHFEIRKLMHPSR